MQVQRIVTVLELGLAAVPWTQYQVGELAIIVRL